MYTFLWSECSKVWGEMLEMCIKVTGLRLVLQVWEIKLPNLVPKFLIVASFRSLHIAREIVSQYLLGMLMNPINNAAENLHLNINFANNHMDYFYLYAFHMCYKWPEGKTQHWIQIWRLPYKIHTKVHLVWLIIVMCVESQWKACLLALQTNHTMHKYRI